MSILKNIISGNATLFVADKLSDFFSPTRDNLFELDIHSNLTNDQTLNSLKEIIDFMKKFSGKEIGYYKFELEEDSCVLLFSRAWDESTTIPQIENYPIFSTFDKINPQRDRFVYDESKTTGDYHGYWYDKSGSIMAEDTIMLKKHNRLLCFIRHVKNNNSGFNLPESLVLFSFINCPLSRQLNVVDENNYFSFYFEAETPGGDGYGSPITARNQMVLFYNNFDKEVVLKNIRILKVNNHRWASVKKMTEFKYSIKGYHVTTIGSNNWDIDIDSSGVFDFIKNDWDSFEEKETRHKL